jgi:choline dehydrogenase-like flavoprotein
MGKPSDLTAQERRLRLALRAGAVVFAFETLAYLLPALIGSAQDDWIQLPFVASSVSKAMLLAGVAFIAGADVRRFGPAVPIIYVATGAWVLSAAAMLLWADTSRSYDIFGIDLSIAAILAGGIALESSLTGLFWWLHRSAQRSRWRLRFLSPTQFSALAALADVLVAGEHEVVAPEEISINVDRYMASFHARRKWVFRVALSGLYFYPLLTLHPPLPLMASEERLQFVRRRFLRDVETRRLLRPLRMLVQAMIRLGQQATYLGYYGDPRSFDSVGYVPFSKRARFGELETELKRESGTVRTISPHLLEGELEADVVVVGSGAAGSILAYELARSGRRVTMLERGEHVDPSTFSEDEVDMISRLYSDGALELSRNFRFQVLQGMCVGGSTVVNNAVCFELPDAVLDRWNDEFDAGLDSPRLRAAFDAVRKRLRITEQPPAHLNPGARKFVDGIEALGLSGGEGFGIVSANIADCLGCGYCNIGCAYGRKLSMLDTVLPEGQQRFGDALQIVAQCRAEGIESDRGRNGGSRATAVHCRLSDGRKLRVRADTVIVSAGAINSSYLLMRSRLGLSTAGRNLCFNMGSPITADFDEELHSYDGLQISHFLEREPSSGFVLETWFNPVVSQALTMPGWFEDHFNNMLRYAHLTATGVLVGTDRNATVKKALTGGVDFSYTPTPKDMARLLEGVKLAGRIYLAAGATRVMPNTFHFHEFRTPEELDRLDELVRDDADISLGSGHPQGGNAICRDPARGVVGPDFRVHGFDNLYVCDASAFPSSTTVNPQMTVMALAEYAAPGIE